MQQPDWTDRETKERVRESAMYGICCFLALLVTYSVYYYAFLRPAEVQGTGEFAGLFDTFPILALLTVFAAWLWYLYASTFKQPSFQRQIVVGVAAIAGFPLTIWAYQTYLQLSGGSSVSETMALALYGLVTLVPVMLIGVVVTRGFTRWVR